MTSHQTSSALPATWRQLVVEENRSKHLRQRIRNRVAKGPALDPITSADVAGLHYVDDATIPGIRRVGCGKRYLDPNGRALSSRAVLKRIASLAIPPAWRDVWICPTPLGHLQATGRDARGRKQYRYHARWREVRDEVKYGRLIPFAEALPRIRARTAADLSRSGLPREKVLAAVVEILEKTLIRIGNDEYARDNHSFGLTTMLNKHAQVNGTSIRFEFRGKSGISHSIDLHDAQLARIVKRCRDLPGHELFQYLDADGHRYTIGSADVNKYLGEISGEAFTAKDFRTWAGTVLAARALAALATSRSTKEAKRRIVRAVECVAKQLGNTTAVCRKCYIHPAILEAYMEGHTIVTPKARGVRLDRARAVLAAIEAAVVAMLRGRLHPHALPT
jgi:DNA topoisomerase I